MSNVDNIMKMADAYADAAAAVEVYLLNGGDYSKQVVAHDAARAALRNAVEELVDDATHLRTKIDTINAQKNWTPFNCPCVEQCHRID